MSRARHEEHGDDELKVVALVGSAGALHAFTTILEPLPPDLEAAVIVTMHLQPGHESLLAEILGRSTAMPVKQAGADDRLEAGRVYVAPPDVHLLVAGGLLELDLGPPIRFLRPSVDVLLGSLAGAFGSRALAVVLSGSGSDGAAGALAMKKAGGTVIAQGPDAEYSGMPRAAVAAGAVDQVLPLNQIAAAILAFVRP